MITVFGTKKNKQTNKKIWTSYVPSAGCSMVHGSLPNQSTCLLWTWRRHLTVSLVAFCGRVLWEYGVRGPLLRAVHSLYDRSRHCMKSGIFVSKRHCRLLWKFRFTTTHGNLQATPKSAVNCRKLTWALLGSCHPMTPLPPKSWGGFNM